MLNEYNEFYMNEEIKSYNSQQTITDKEICEILAATIANELTDAENKIWHANQFGFWTTTQQLDIANKKKA
jgi:hypothetical protein